jgi:predicted lactoylglutathione lyase
MQTFINLPVKDLTRTTAFFTELGFAFDPQFTDDNATRMVVNDQTSVMFAVEPFFSGFIAPQTVADTSQTREVLVGLATESREQLESLRSTAVAAGAASLGDPIDDGFMYMWGFRDPDGHQWSFIHMSFG